MDTSIQKYRAFVEAVDAGSLAAAASRMGYSTSSVSRMVADLERDCRVRLLERDKAGVRTTPDGERLLARARRVVAACNGFDEEAAAIRGVESGSVRIGTVSSVATHILPSAMATFRETHPQVDFELLLGDYEEIESWLVEGRVDLGALKAPAPRRLKSRLLVHDRLVAIVPNGHPLAASGSFPLEAFAEEPFLALERGDISEVSPLFEAAGIIIQPAFSTWDDYAIMAMVEAGMGLAILPELITRRNAYDITTVPLEVPADRSIDIAWRSTAALPVAARSFIEVLLGDI